MEWSMYLGAALVSGAWHGHIACVRILIQLGAGTLNQLMLAHALAIAAHTGHHQIVDLLLQAGASATAANGLPLQALFFDRGSANDLCSERLNSWLEHDIWAVWAVSSQPGNTPAPGINTAAPGINSCVTHAGSDAEAEVEVSVGFDLKQWRCLPPSRSQAAVALIKASADVVDNKGFE
jgi:hypothetical protein